MLPFETRQELETNWPSPILTHAALVYSFGSIGCASLSAPLASDSSLRVSDFLEEISESGNSNSLSKPLTFNCLQKVIQGYDSFLGKKCPYIMGLHAAPNFEDDKFHFHVEFYPPLRSGDKPKILAGSESMAGVFIMDLLPEDSAKILREHMNI